MNFSGRRHRSPYPRRSVRELRRGKRDADRDLEARVSVPSVPSWTRAAPRATPASDALPIRYWRMYALGAHSFRHPGDADALILLRRKTIEESTERWRATTPCTLFPLPTGCCGCPPYHPLLRLSCSCVIFRWLRRDEEMGLSDHRMTEAFSGLYAPHRSSATLLFNDGTMYKDAMAWKLKKIPNGFSQLIFDFGERTRKDHLSMMRYRMLGLARFAIVNLNFNVVWYGLNVTYIYIYICVYFYSSASRRCACTVVYLKRVLKEWYNRDFYYKL